MRKNECKKCGHHITECQCNVQVWEENTDSQCEMYSKAEIKKAIDQTLKDDIKLQMSIKQAFAVFFENLNNIKE